MTITYSDDIRNQRLQDVINALDAGPGPAVMKIGTAGMGFTIANIILSSPSFQGPVAGVMQLADCPRSDNDTANGGVAEEAIICDGTGAVKVTGLTCGLAGSGAEIILSRLDYQAHDRLDISSGVIRHA